MGKHNAPRKPITPTLIRAGATALALTGPIALNTGSANAAETSSVLEVIAKCESGNRNVATGLGSTASGYLQILDSTWKAFGGKEFAARAMHASREEQFIVGQRILAGQGISAWNPSRSCWSGKVSTTKKVVVPDPPKKTEVKVEKKVPTAATPPVKKKVVQTIKKQKQTTATSTSKKVAQSYLIRRGDTLTRIAKHHGTSVSRLVKLNSDTVKNPDRIYAGRHLRLG